MPTDSPSQPTPIAQAQIAGLQAELEKCRAEIGNLKLQLDILSTTDSISGLPNVHGMIDIAEDASARMSRTGEPFGLMMIRVPELEQINAGPERDLYRDAVRHSAALVVAALRQVDRVGRLDTSTFLAVLPALTAEGAGTVVGRLSTLLGSVPLAFESGETVRLRPEIAVVLAAPDGSGEVPVLLDVLYDAREEAEFETPVVVQAPAADRPHEIHIA